MTIDPKFGDILGLDDWKVMFLAIDHSWGEMGWQAFYGVTVTEDGTSEIGEVESWVLDSFNRVSKAK